MFDVENIKETRNSINQRFQRYDRSVRSMRDERVSSFRVREQAEARQRRLQEASTVRQFIRDLEDEEAQIK